MKKRIWGILQGSLYLALIVFFIYALLHYENRYWMLVSGILGLLLGVDFTISEIKNHTGIPENENEEEITRFYERLWVGSLAKAIGLVLASIFAIIFSIQG